nr:hypothetical protein CFP56_54378 [Quercus suber]
MSSLLVTTGPDNGKWAEGGADLGQRLHIPSHRNSHISRRGVFASFQDLTTIPDEEEKIELVKYRDAKRSFVPLLVLKDVRLLSHQPSGSHYARACARKGGHWDEKLRPNLIVSPGEGRLSTSCDRISDIVWQFGVLAFDLYVLCSV